MPIGLLMAAISLSVIPNLQLHSYLSMTCPIFTSVMYVFVNWFRVCTENHTLLIINYIYIYILKVRSTWSCHKEEALLKA